MPQRHSGVLGACLVAGVLAFLGAPRGAAAFGQMNMPGASVQEQCIVGFQGLRKACGNVAAGQAAPPIARCDSGVCQQAVLAWWPKCKSLSMFSTLDSSNHQQITIFYAACKQRSMRRP